MVDKTLLTINVRSAGRAGRLSAFFGAAGAVAVGLGGASLVGCSSTTTPVQPISAGTTADTLSVPDAALGGMIEYARVRFAGDSLSTALVGDPEARRGDGLLVTVGGAGFAHPRSDVPREAYLALPTGPVLRSDETLRCTLQAGPTRIPKQFPGIKVDVGSTIALSGGRGALNFALKREPQLRTGDFAQTLNYFHMEPLRSSDDNWNEVNWSNGAALTVRMGGARIPEAREFASLPVATTAADTVSLPVPLDGLKIQGRAVTLPVLDPMTGAVLSTPTRFELPEAGGSLDLSWQTSTSPDTLVVALEYFGAGSGHCPRDCGEASECCQTDLQCGDGERCEPLLEGGASACFPSDGDLSQRLGALVCTLEDNGSASLPSAQIDALNAQVTLADVRGVVLRVGRSTSVETAVSDLMTSDGTRHTLSPVMLRASDVVLVRFNAPKQGGQ